MSENKAHFLALIGQPPGGRGRNTKYDPDVHCQMVMDLGQAGEFQEAWASEIGITITTMRDCVRKHEEFREAVIIAHQLLVTYWTRKVAENVTAEGAKPGMFQILSLRELAFPRIERMQTDTEPLRNLLDRVAPLRDLRHRVTLELVCEIACAHHGLLASKLAKKASTKHGVIQSEGHVTISQGTNCSVQTKSCPCNKKLNSYQILKSRA